MGEEWKTAKLPTLYTKAAKAMIECATIDECLEWKSKMNQVASYARQANDTTMMDKAVEIRNRARRRMGQILSGTPPARGANQNIRDAPVPKVGRIALANDVGIPERERKAAMRLAAMPEKEFERRVKDQSLGMQKGKTVPGSFRCPHCGRLIVR